MNKRIQELITQAGGHWNHGDFNMPSSVEFQEQDIAKFAELIVRECVAQCGSQADRKSILKHFGLPVESNIKYPGPDAHWSVTSQYSREYNMPDTI